MMVLVYPHNFNETIIFLKTLFKTLIFPFYLFCFAKQWKSSFNKKFAEKHVELQI